MSIGNRIGRLELENFAEACRRFRPWFLDHLRDPDTERRERVWAESQPTPPADQAWEEAVDPVILLLMEHPENHVGIRVALARMAPHLGLRAGDPPLAILAALRAGFDGS
jgi:hypothetical protein